MKKEEDCKRKKNAPQFSSAERRRIEELLEEELSKREIARRLGREPSSIRYELRHNRVRGRYIAAKAHLKAYQRRWRARWQVLKIGLCAELREYVDRHLKEYWSPEGISGRLKYVDRSLPYVGKDAIYAYADRYCMEEYLWWRGKKCKPRVPRETIPNRVMIDDRPKSVGERRYFGDWEGDFIVSGRNGSGALLVLVERKSRYVILWKLADRKVATVNGVLGKILGGGQLVVRSLTLDNDISFRLHEEMSELIGAPVFFCHPYHSWEKGTVEKMNQLIRRFIPKGTNIANVSEERISWIARILNNRPYECLQFRTPAETIARSAKLKTFVKRTLGIHYSPLTVGG